MGEGLDLVSAEGPFRHHADEARDTKESLNTQHLILPMSTTYMRVVTQCYQIPYQIH
jgi:hypothetical protein